MPFLKKMRRMSDLLFKTVKEALTEKQKTIEEKAIEFLKDKKEISRVDFWIYIGDTYLADSILYSLYDQKKIEMIRDHDGTKIIWKE